MSSTANGDGRTHRLSWRGNPLFNSEQLRDDYRQIQQQQKQQESNGSASSLSGIASFPLLPRSRVMPRTDIDPSYRYHQLRSGSHLTSVINDPTSMGALADPLPLVILPYPGLSDEEIGVDSLRAYVRLMAPITRSFSRTQESEDMTAGFAESSATRERIQQAEREAEQSLSHCLRIVPEMYFSSDYRVNDPNTFGEMAVSVQSMLRQEKLSHYLDLVEINLLKQISARSHSFFTALVTMQKLHNEVAKGTQTIAKIRRRINVLRKRLVVGTMTTVQGNRRLKNMNSVIEALELMSAVLNAQQGVKELIAVGEYTQALDILENSHASLDNELKGVKCLYNAKVKLRESFVLVVKLVVSELMRVAVYGSTDDVTGIVDMNSCVEYLTSCVELSDDEQSVMLRLVGDVARTHSVSEFLSAYKDEMTQCITQWLKDLVTWQLQEIDVSASGNMLEQLHHVTHMQFVKLLENMFSALHLIVRRCLCIWRVVRTHTEEIAVGNSDVDRDDDDEVDDRPFDQRFHETVCSVVEYMHSRCARILGARAEIHYELDLAQLRLFFDVSLRFVVKCEQDLNKTFYGLRGALLTQAKGFLEKFHIRNINRLALSLEKEQWARVAVPRRYQVLIDRGFMRKSEPLVINPQQQQSNKSAKNGASLISSLKNSTVSWDDDEVSSKTTTASPTSESTPEKTSRVIFVADTNPETGKQTGTFARFPLVPSVLLLLDMVASYVECAMQLQAVGSDVLHRLVEMLKLFNSRTCQLVLGAGAMHLAGLKSINAKHLALSSQCLGLIISQIPAIHKALHRHLPEKHVVMLSSLDRVQQDYANHQKEILEKLVTIVRELTEFTGKSLIKLEWAVQGMGNANGVKRSRKTIAKADVCIHTLMKQTASLHRVLSELLPAHQRDSVFRDIASVFSETLCKYLSRIGSTDEYVRSHVSANVKYVIKRIRAMDGVPSDSCSELSVFVS